MGRLAGSGRHCKMGRKKQNLTLQKYSAALPSKKLPSGRTTLFYSYLMREMATPTYILLHILLSINLAFEEQNWRSKITFPAGSCFKYLWRKGKVFKEKVVLMGNFQWLYDRLVLLATVASRVQCHRQQKSLPLGWKDRWSSELFWVPDNGIWRLKISEQCKHCAADLFLTSYRHIMSIYFNISARLPGWKDGLGIRVGLKQRRPL